MCLLVTACGGSDLSTLNKTSNTTTRVEKSTTALSNNIEGAFLYDLPITIQFQDAKQYQQDLPSTAYAYSQSVTSTENFFWLDGDAVRIGTVLTRESEFSKNLPTANQCVFFHSNEHWKRLNDKNYRVSNKGFSTEVQIQSNSEALFITKPSGNMRFARIDRNKYVNIPLCSEASVNYLPTLPLHNHLIKDIAKLKGLWQKPQSVQPFDIAFSRGSAINSQQSYINIDGEGKATLWHLDAKNKCFTDIKKNIDYSFIDGTALLVSNELNITSNASTITNHLAYDISVETSEGFYGNHRTNRYIYLHSADAPFAMPPVFLSQANPKLSVETMRCELSQNALEKLERAATVEDIKGVWSLKRTNNADLHYLHISDDLILTRYDFKGDEVNKGANCYQKNKVSTLTLLDKNLFEENFNITLNNLISFLKTDKDELVIRLKNQQGNEYNRPLKRDAELTRLGITPLCPSIRN